MTADEKPRMQQFWLRALLVVGLLWGGMPFLTLPLVLMGVVAAPFGMLVALVNGLTVAPACTLAFWHRRVACGWLSLNAVMCGIAIALSEHKTGDRYFVAMTSLAGSIAIAVCLDFMEIRHWPAAVGDAGSELPGM
jgi:hypothetical protein